MARIQYKFLRFECFKLTEKYLELEKLVFLLELQLQLTSNRNLNQSNQTTADAAISAASSTKENTANC